MRQQLQRGDCCGLALIVPNITQQQADFLRLNNGRARLVDDLAELLTDADGRIPSNHSFDRQMLEKQAS